MSQFILALASLTALFGALSATPVIEAKTYAEKFALSRDGLGRVDPDALADGFFAAWPVVMLALSAFFAVLFVIFGIGHLTGICGKGQEKSYKSVAQV